ncbi:peptidoglycan editing factor PgeF [Parvularcula lutaonensis]|uniref:Purine nucleoside phosphorylase n=1 Tax=Parvularcula lutaonensis TaxID=491923 RepID=A0ABV7MB43_9PROT|nr:peptidoglycan editing factor PgeF [Parvularcula lutaonensis]GGY39710.1 laccase domain protein [Parvularcula lutaonensis]
MSPPRLVSALISSPHGFFSREGGVSKGVFAGLNGSFHSGDAPEPVVENRRRIARALGADHVLTAKQTHSARALFIDVPFDHDRRPEADALVTLTPGLAVAVLTADCVPILIEGGGMVAAVHAGWRGSLLGIIQSTVDLMASKGAEPSELRAVIGPSLRRASFEVRDDLIAQVTAGFPEATRHFEALGTGRSLYDHTGFVRDRLQDAGITADRIDDVGGDTLAESERYFSYRAAQRRGEKQFGHNVSAIMVTLA